MKPLSMPHTEAIPVRCDGKGIDDSGGGRIFRVSGSDNKSESELDFGLGLRFVLASALDLGGDLQPVLGALSRVPRPPHGSTIPLSGNAAVMISAFAPFAGGGVRAHRPARNCRFFRGSTLREHPELTHVR